MQIIFLQTGRSTEKDTRRTDEPAMCKVNRSSGPDSTKIDADKVTICDLLRIGGPSDVAGTILYVEYPPVPELANAQRPSGMTHISSRHSNVWCLLSYMHPLPENDMHMLVCRKVPLGLTNTVMSSRL